MCILFVLYYFDEVYFLYSFCCSKLLLQKVYITCILKVYLKYTSSIHSIVYFMYIFDILKVYFILLRGVIVFLDDKLENVEFCNWVLSTVREHAEHFCSISGNEALCILVLQNGQI